MTLLKVIQIEIFYVLYFKNSHPYKGVYRVVRIFPQPYKG